MNFKENKVFDNYMQNFKLLKVEDKRNFIEKELKETIATLGSVQSYMGKEPTDFIINKEMINSNYSEDDFLENLLVYITNMQEFLANIFIKGE